MQVEFESCENCMYVNEPSEGLHCSCCIHNAIENFTPITVFHYCKDSSEKLLALYHILADKTDAEKKMFLKLRLTKEIKEMIDNGQSKG